jgi:hypothetical protein
MNEYKVKIKIQEDKVVLTKEDGNQYDMPLNSMLSINPPNTDTAIGYFMYDILEKIKENPNLEKNGFYNITLDTEKHDIKIS